MTLTPRQERLRAVRQLHTKWALANVHSAGSAFSPIGRVDGSDYNQHHADLDAAGDAQDAFVADALALIAGIGVLARADVLTRPRAAAEAHTGAMIALVPTAADATRLAVEGGEPADELHVTLRYLGKGADFSAQSREHLIELVRAYAEQLRPFTADAFNVAIFNPAGDEPCVVLGLGGDDIVKAHAAAETAVEDYGADLPEPHKPFVPHLTLEYTDDAGRVEELTDRVGLIAFDRIRVAFAGEVTDIPLTHGKKDAADTARLRAQVEPDVAAALATLRALRQRLSGTKVRDLDEIIVELMGMRFEQAQALLLRADFNESLHKRDGKGRFTRTGALGSVLEKLEALRGKLGDDERAELDRAMDQLRGLESSDVDDDDLNVDEPEDDGRGLVMDSASGELAFTTYTDGDIGVDWDEGSVRFTPQQAREVSAAINEFAALPVVASPELPEWEVPASVTTREEYSQWWHQQLNEWYESPAWDDYNAVVGEFTTADGELKVTRGGSGVFQIGDPDVVDDPDGEGVLQLDDPDEGRVFVDMLLVAAPSVSNLAGTVFFQVRVQQSRQRLAKYDPTQRRDDDGKWAAFGGIPAFHREHMFANGTVTATVGKGGLQLSLANNAGGTGKSGGLDNGARWKLAEVLESAADPDYDADRKSVYSYPDDGGDRSQPSGFAEVSYDGEGLVELELLDSDEKIKLSRAEAGALSQSVRRSAGVSRVAMASGPLDVFPTDDRKVGLRLNAADGTVVEPAFDGKSWTRIRNAQNVVWEGFDEFETFVKAGEDDNGDVVYPDVDTIDVDTNLGRVRVHRDGAITGGPDDPNYGSETLSFGPVDGGWKVAWPGDYRHPAFEAFEAIETFGSYEEWPGIENAAPRLPQAVVWRPLANRAGLPRAEFTESQHKRDRRGRFSKSAGQVVSELDDLMAKLSKLTKDMGEDEDDNGEAETALEALKDLRERRHAKANRREASMETAYGEVSMSIAGDGDITLDFDNGGFFLPPQEAKQLAGVLDGFRATTLPGWKLGDEHVELSRVPLGDHGELSALLWTSGLVEIGPSDKVGNPDEAETDVLLLEDFDEAADFADLLEELADRSLAGDVSNTAVVLPQALYNHPGHPDQKVHGRPGRGKKLPDVPEVVAVPEAEPAPKPPAKRAPRKKAEPRKKAVPAETQTDRRTSPDAVTGDAALAVLPRSLDALTAAKDPRADALWYRAGDNRAETASGRPGSFEMSAQMRGTEKMTPETKARVKAIDAVMAESPLPEPILVYRGAERIGGVRPDEAIGERRNLVGKEFTDKAFVSTTTDAAHASWFGGTVLRITVPEGTSAIRMADRKGTERDQQESEILLDRGLTFRVVAQHGRGELKGDWGGAYVLDVEVAR